MSEKEKSGRRSSAASNRPSFVRFVAVGSAVAAVIAVAVGPTDVFGADRNYVGTYAPDEARVPSAFGPDGLVAYREVDEMDVPSIVVKRAPAAVSQALLTGSGRAYVVGPGRNPPARRPPTHECHERREKVQSEARRRE